MADGRKKLASRSIVASAALVALLGAGIAYAAWTTNGAGSGYAKAGTAQSLTTLDASGSVTNTLVPGGSGDFAITIKNTNPYAVSVSAVTTGTPAGSGGTGTCTTTGVTINTATVNATLPWSVPANGTLTKVVANGASMDNTSDTGCQGATFTVPVTLTGTSS